MNKIPRDDSEEVVVINVGPGGVVRAVYDDDFPLSDLGPPPKRAGEVEPIQSGPYAGHWYVDVSPLGDDFAYYLWPPQPTRRQALRQERGFVVRHWVRGIKREP